MSAEPVPRAPVNPGHDPAAIRSVLPPEDRNDFVRFYGEALDEAKRAFSLQPVTDVLEQWRRKAVLCQSPHHAEVMETARRFAAGEDVPVFEVDLEALARGEVPVAWPASR